MCAVCYSAHASSQGSLLQVSKDESPYDNYKPYPVQQKIDKTDPLYEEFLKQQETDQAARAASTQPPEDVNTYDAKKATQFGMSAFPIYST